MRRAGLVSPLPSPAHSSRRRKTLIRALNPLDRLRLWLAGIADSVSLARTEVAALREEVAILSEAVGALARDAERRDEELRSMLHVLGSRETDLRSALWRARDTEAYERAYSEPEPLVSVVIPTFNNPRLLIERSIPSALSQSYERVEVVVIGDAAGRETVRAMQAIDDPRVRFYNLNVRGPYPDDPVARWHVAGTPPYNEAVRRARGAWIAPLGDDDSFRPDHVERLLSEARERRLEVAYGRYRAHFREGSAPQDIGVFPPRFQEFTMQTMLYPRALAFFELELSDALFGIPGDWALIERMLRCGVRFGMLDEIVCDVYPSWSWNPGDRSPPTGQPATAAPISRGSAASAPSE